MKNKLLLIAVLVLAFLTIGARFTPTTYEYKFETSISEKKANELGAEGWELVGFDSRSGGGTVVHITTFVFKRPK